MSNNRNLPFGLSNGLIGNGILIAGALATAYDVASRAYEFYQQAQSMQNNSAGMRSNPSDRQSDSNRNNCGICDSELRLNLFSNTSMVNYLCCQICATYYHKDCHPAKVLKLKFTKKCPKCDSRSLRELSTVD